MSDLKYLPCWAKLLLIWLCFLAVAVPGCASAIGVRPESGYPYRSTGYPWQLVIRSGHGLVLADAYDNEAECVAAAASAAASKFVVAFCYRR